MSDYESRIAKKAVQLIKEDKIERVPSGKRYDMWDVDGSDHDHLVKKETHSNKFSCDCQFNTTHVDEKDADTKGTCSHITAAMFLEGLPHLSALVEQDLLNLVSKWRGRAEEMDKMSESATDPEKVQSFAVEDCIDDLEEVLISR